MNAARCAVGGIVIVILLVFSPIARSASQNTKGTDAQTTASETPQAQAASENRTPNDPPESAYDRMVRNTKDSAPAERSLAAQLLQTLLALGLVIGLIYFLFKVGLGRFLPGSQTAMFTKRGDREIRVSDRIAIDGKNSVAILEIPNQRRILVGSGERGVEFLCELEAPKPPANGSETEESA